MSSARLIKIIITLSSLLYNGNYKSDSCSAEENSTYNLSDMDNSIQQITRATWPEVDHHAYSG